MAAVKILGEPVLLPMLILLGFLWLVPHTSIPALLSHRVSRLPAVKLDLHPTQTFLARYPANKTALYIETRPHVHHITPLLLHMMEVVPPEWRFLFLGSPDTVRKVNASSPVRRYQEYGKLRLEVVDPLGWGWREGEDVNIDELYSRLLTSTGFYERELRGTEWLLVFHSDAVLCANSHRDVNEFLEWDWVGAPWNLEDRFGGNGGLSLRRVSRVLEVLQFQTRLDNSFSEDQWMASRVGLIPGANMASPEIEREFAVEDIWTERPMGYHINPTMGPGSSPDVWDDPRKRKMIYDYCPEIKIILDMRLEREQCAVVEVAAAGVEAMGKDGLLPPPNMADAPELNQPALKIPDPRLAEAVAEAMEAFKHPKGGQA